MGVINTYFSAPDDAAAAVVVDDGPAATRSPAVDAVDASVQAATLFALLAGDPIERITEDSSWARLVSAPEHESAWVVSMPQTFADALAAASDERLVEVVGPWSQTEEFWGAGDPEQLLTVLHALRELARTARERGEQMYCWMAL